VPSPKRNSRSVPETEELRLAAAAPIVAGSETPRRSVPPRRAVGGLPIIVAWIGIENRGAPQAKPLDLSADG